MRAWLAALLLLAPPAALAQADTLPPPPNPRFQSVEYSADTVFTLRAAPGYQIIVELAPDERVENVAVGDSSGWQVTANRRGDRLFVKAVRGDVSTNMTVITDARLYSFELVPLPGPQPDMAYALRFRYPTPAGATAEAAPEPQLGRYKMRGTKALLPSGMHDDGVHTYIEWPPERSLPAIYAVNDQGKETLVNGMMRDGRMVIDSIQAKLIFRIDNRSATAVRVVARGR
ncbi:TrbG/VirB9 family P-type conjugative transfer protein [Sphingomonas sp. LM7]|uniref:TrbG/VirB9 family P-type conjugative transfer protein n=1 Tax=Sphingomonas sp. LM7 TaxID=1938607 RepID=UPI0015C57316|nr:TrbG/VirB9 family P-type conjugative transfer protein [Sphingomonas sp. LM7]